MSARETVIVVRNHGTISAWQRFKSSVAVYVVFQAALARRAEMMVAVGHVGYAQAATIALRWAHVLRALVARRNVERISAATHVGCVNRVTSAMKKPGHVHNAHASALPAEMMAVETLVGFVHPVFIALGISNVKRLL